MWLISLAALPCGLDDGIVLHPIDGEKMDDRVDRAADQYVESPFDSSRMPVWIR
jgi:hypothetical protein